MYPTYLKASCESKGFESMTSVILGALLYHPRYYSNREFSSVRTWTVKCKIKVYIYMASCT